MNPLQDQNDDRNRFTVPQRQGDSLVPTRGNENIQGQPASQQAAVGVVRTQLETIYQTAPPNGEVANRGYVDYSSGASVTMDKASVYNREHGDPSDYDWRQYHAAWQQYYQQYYAQYYNAELQRQQLLTPQAPSAITGESVSQTNQRRAAAEALRQELAHKVKAHARRVRASSHFMPILTALIVGSVFFFLQYNKVVAAEVNAYISPSSTVSDNVIVDPNASTDVSADPRLIIPKINVDVPMVYGLQSLDNNASQKLLENGVIHYPIPGADSLPGQTGNSVFLGHSSNDVLAPGNFKFALVLLERMQPGDLFYIHYKSKRYIYRVTQKLVIEPNEVEKLILPNDKPVATLVTCVPIGTSRQRLLVFGDQISPDPSIASKNENAGKKSNQADIPGNEPSILQRIFGL